MSEKTRKQKLQELQQSQINGEVKTIQANKNEEVQISESEKDMVHVRLSRKVHNPASQTYDEQSRTESISPLDFAQMEANNAFHTAGWVNVEILHDPRRENTSTEASKPLTEKQQLLVDYKNLTGEEANKDWTVADLKEEIAKADQNKA